MSARPRGENGVLTQHPEAGKLALCESDVAAPHYRKVGDGWVLTNDLGQHSILGEKEFRDYLAGTLDKDSDAWLELRQKGFLKKYLDFERHIEDYRLKNRFLFTAAALHIIVTTARCNHKCLYCHSSVVGLKRKGVDMTPAHAKKAVDLAFDCPNPDISLEFQGGEPTLNWPVIEFVTKYARLKNEASGRGVFLSLVTTFSTMNTERFKFLIDEKISICTSLDGPAELHNQNRIYTGGNSQEETVRWVKKFLAYQDEKGRRPFKPGALMTTTRLSMDYGTQIIDLYVELGLPGIFLRPLSPIGFAKRAWDKIGYTPEEYLAFYRKNLDYILELNYKGTRFFERMARTLLVKILDRRDPIYVDLRSPSGAGLGVIGYDYDGSIYTGDEARMLAAEGNSTFKIGHVDTSGYNDLVGHPLVKAAAVSSLLENQPVCSKCVYKPYCGQDATYNQQTQNTLWGRMPDNGRCQIFMGVFDILFEKLQDPKARAVFEDWLKNAA
jgi:His-Xaa-Ser system radical SAM maturase HxsB